MQDIDLISRQDAIATVCNITDEIDGAEDIGDKIMIALGDLPSVSTEKTGRWIQTNEFFINQDGQFIYKFICSECKSLSYFRKSNKKAIGANVCPNCGAKMEVEE